MQHDAVRCAVKHLDVVDGAALAHAMQCQATPRMPHTHVAQHARCVEGVVAAVRLGRDGAAAQAATESSARCGRGIPHDHKPAPRLVRRHSVSVAEQRAVTPHGEGDWRVGCAMGEQLATALDDERRRAQIRGHQIPRGAAQCAPLGRVDSAVAIRVELLQHRPHKCPRRASTLKLVEQRVRAQRAATRRAAGIDAR